MMNAESSPSDGGHRGSGWGARFRLRREQLGLTLEEAARRVRLPVHVLSAIERDDWSSLGAAVFVRGHLRAYGRLLGIDEAALERALPYDLPPLVVSGPVVPVWRRRAVEWGRGALYALLTIFIVVPATMFVLERSPREPQLLPLDESAAPAKAQAPVQSSRPEQVADWPAPTGPDPLLASLFPPRALERLSPSPAPVKELQLRTSASSWIEVRAADGTRLEFATLPAGSERRYPLGQGLALTIGNVAGTELSIGDRKLAIEPWARANVARFRLSSQGEIEPLVDP